MPFQKGFLFWVFSIYEQAFLIYTGHHTLLSTSTNLVADGREYNATHYRENGKHFEIN